MNTKFKFVLLSVCVIAALFTSCNPAPVNKDNDIAFDSIRVDKKYHLLNDEKNPNCDLNINFIFPSKLENPDVLKELQHQFVFLYFGEEYQNMTPQEAVQKYSSNYINQYKELEDDFKMDSQNNDSPVSAWYSYFETTFNEIIYNKNNILSCVTNFENYTGGAHGSHGYSNNSFNLKTGKPIMEKDIFVDNFEEDLSKILVEKIAEEKKVEKIEDLENIGFFSIDEIYPNGNMLLTEEGILYTFNEYEIAAYVVGAVHVLLPYDEISFLLKPESPVAPFLNN